MQQETRDNIATNDNENATTVTRNAALGEQTPRRRYYSFKDLGTAPIKPFSGDKKIDAAQWLRVVERCTFDDNWPDADILRETIECFEGDAELWYTALRERGRVDSRTTWTEFKALFAERYIQTENVVDIVDKFMDCKQLKTETVGEFATRIEDLARRTELP